MALQPGPARGRGLADLRAPWRRRRVRGARAHFRDRAPRGRLRLIPITLVVASFLILEARRAAKNERAQRARGGIEPAGDVYRIMRFAYPGSFLLMIVEGALRPSSATAALVAGVSLFAAAKALKWWAIVALGSFWTFRVIVVPGAALVTRGPYRLVRHPNYVAVAGELVGVALMTGAIITGPIATLAFGALMLKRINVEDRLLRQAPGAPPVDPERDVILP